MLLPLILLLLRDVKLRMEPSAKNKRQGCNFNSGHHRQPQRPLSYHGMWVGARLSRYLVKPLLARLPPKSVENPVALPAVARRWSL